MKQNDPRLVTMLDELLTSQATPEEVCAAHPELLPELRQQWNGLSKVRAELELLFPAADGDDASLPPHSFGQTDLPQIPGYEFEGILGRGGSSVVYRALHRRLNRTVALKMLLAGVYATPEELERFQREAEAVAGLRHPNIVQLYDAGDVDRRPYFTMEMVEGGTLSAQLAGTPQQAHAAAALAAVLADAVQFAHERGIVHRDLKPSNILLTSDGTPKVSDFGLARQVELGQLTLTAATIGTPSYMSPEQARGDRSEINLACDVYALGAILYEMLTGRPPFRGESSTATIQQVMANEVVRPRRLNPNVPRDLETICLKCLQKEPSKRYASAAALADDLRRFERGETIEARPVGPLERTARWARRRPALAGALTIGALMALALAVTVIWWHGQRTALAATAVAYAEADLSESERLRDKGEIEASAEVLNRAKDRLGEYIPPHLHERLSNAVRNLDLVTRLDAIRMDRAMLSQGFSLQNALVGSTATKEPGLKPRGGAASQRYEDAFREAGLGSPKDDPADVAAQITSSPMRSALLAGLDDWAACAADRDQQTWVVAVVRHADPNSWRDRARDPATWADAEALRTLSASALATEQPPQLLVLLAARLRAKAIDAAPFLRRVVSAYPNDFWANVEMGNILIQSKPAEAIGYYRTALALRPETVSLHFTLSVLYFQEQRFDECLAHAEHAVRLDPNDAWCHIALGAALTAQPGRVDQAIAEFREALRIDPDAVLAHRNLAATLEATGRLEEAVDGYSDALRRYPKLFAEDRPRLRILLLKLGRLTEARAKWKEELAAHPPDHDTWFGYAELCLFLGDETEYRLARSNLLAQFGSATDPSVAERTARACLLLPATEAELRQAIALIDHAVDAGRVGHEAEYPYYLFGQGLARYRQGRFDDAIKLMSGEAASVLGPSPRLVLAMAQYQKGQKDQAGETLAMAIGSYDWSAEKAMTHDDWIAHILRREAEALILP